MATNNKGKYVPPPQHFYFMRHGETPWNLAGRYQGHMNVHLNATGRQQASAAAHIFERLEIAQVVSSDLSRAYETALLAMARRPTTPIYRTENLREWFLGEWEGRMLADVAIDMGLPPETSPAYARMNPPGGETWDEFKHRIQQALADILSTYTGNTLLVAHGFVFIALTEILLGHPQDMCTNAQPFLFKQTHTGWQLESI